MDISSTLEPNSDQLDAVELLGGPRIFTIESASRGSEEQPVNIHLVDFPRPWRPGKSMRRVLAFCWGVDASAYVGHRVELFCDPSVRFGADAVGGTRISRLSHIDKVQKIPLLVSRGKSATYTVDPLPDTESNPPPVTDSDGVTKPQLAKMHATFNDMGVTDRTQRLELTRGLLQRDLISANELTKAEASTLIDLLEQCAGEPDPLLALRVLAGIGDAP